MGIFIAYAFALLCTTIFVVQKGGAIGRWSIAGIWIGFISAQIASLSIEDDHIFLLTICAIESVSFCYKVAVAAYSNRRWPMIVSGLHLNVVAAQISIILSPQYLTKILYGMSTIWAVPVLFVMIVGITMDRRWDRRTRGVIECTTVSNSLSRYRLLMWGSPIK